MSATASERVRLAAGSAGSRGSFGSGFQGISTAFARSFNGAASRTGLPLDNIHDNFLYMERVGLLILVRDPEKKYPDEIATVNMTDASRRLCE